MAFAVVACLLALSLGFFAGFVVGIWAHVTANGRAAQARVIGEMEDGE